MKTTIPSIEIGFWRRRLMTAVVAFGLMSVFAIAQTAVAQTTPPPLNFGNNFFVTGDYVVAGVGLRGLGDSTGYAKGYINMPDATTRPDSGVPTGAQVVAAFLYWQTVESSQTTYAGQHGFFGPSTGPANGYAITGTLLGNPNAPVAWSSGGCSGSSQGSKTIRTYRADVRAYLPADPEGNVVANGSYVVRLADSGSNGGGVPLTLGASLVIIYRVMEQDEDHSVLDDHDASLNSIVIYDGTFVPSNSSSDMTQAIEGFYEAAAHPITKLTEIVGNGQPNKYETVSLNNDNLSSLYGNGLLPPFPGIYDQNTISPTGGGSWDNPTWIFQSTDTNNPVKAKDSTATATVTPSTSNSGCVSWGAVIFSTTVQDTDGDGLLDKWEKDQGYCDVSVPSKYCTVPTDLAHPPSPIDDPGWVALPGANPDEKDIYVQMDYMCKDPNATSCDTTDGSSFLPSDTALGNVVTAFSKKGITLHLIPTNMIPQETCTDDLTASPPVLCPVPNQPGVVSWKGGFAFLKNQWVDADGTPCNQEKPGSCEPRFQHGRKDSYHYALFGNALDAPSWAFIGGNLISVVVSGDTVTFNTKTDPRLSPTNPTGVVAEDSSGGNGRVTVSGVVSDPNFNGTFKVTGATATGFSIQDGNLSSTSAAPTPSTDPHLTVASGKAGTISGASDVGGEDTAVTLGSWGADGESDNVQEGIFMHELGHTLGLTHGGTYYLTSGSYMPTYGPNCKPNYQSVMNYLFTVDLLGTSQALDYSEQKLSPLDETNLPAGVTTTNGSDLAYSTTRWYSTSPPGGVGTPAKAHCDGTPILPTDVQPTMYRLSGKANKISPAWTSPEDVDFDGGTQFDSNLRGYDDWTNLNLRQMGAAGNLSTAGGPGAAFNFGPGAAFNFGPGAAFNFGPGAAFNFGPGAAFNFGPGDAEITLDQANSVTRPPRDLTATVFKSPTSIRLDWIAPTFGQIGAYRIYLGVDGAAPAYHDTATSTTYTDKKVSCGHKYTYFVTAVLAPDDTQESVASNTVTVSKCTVQ